MRGLFGKILTGLFAAAFLASPAAHAADGDAPQEYQTSVEPARRRVIPKGYYPATRVRLPEQKLRSDVEPISAPWFSNFAEGGNEIFAARAPALRSTYMEVEENVTTGAWYDNFAGGDNDIFGNSTKPKQVEREAETDGDGYLIFSSAAGSIGSTTAYASMPLPDFMDDDAVTEGDDLHLPKPFSFSSDDSPIILADVTSPGPDGTFVAERRTNRHRLFSGRRPAEIIERDPYNYAPDARPNPDTPAMVPAAGGKVRRAEVKLPTSSQGLGMASGYFPGR